LRSAVVLWSLAVLGSYIFRRALEADAGLPPGYAHYAFVSQLGVFCGGIVGYWSYSKFSVASEMTKRKLWWLALALGPVLTLFMLTDEAIFLVSAGRPDMQLLGLSFGFIAALSAISSKKWMAHRVFQHIGERSYSIYLIHAVIIYLMAPLTRGLYEICYPTLGGYGFGICALLVLGPTLIVSELTYRIVEVPGIALGRRWVRD
jgi:peptidoglycan/LPS O-acetylase OafA/YrhL